jgi:hypothetical protein
MFDNLEILKTGKQIKDAAKARLNREQVETTLDPTTKTKLEVISRNLVDDGMYPFSLQELDLLGL